MNAADLLLSAVAGAMVVVSGGLYALFFALSRLRHSRWLACAAAASYCTLAAFTFLLAERLELEQAWTIVVAVMLGGYLLAPLAIWHLTVATHAQTTGETD